MAILAFIVDESLKTDEGTRLMPGVLMSDSRPEVGLLIQGTPIMLKQPDGTEIHTPLLNYGVSLVDLGDGNVGMPEDPYVEFLVNATEEEIPIGTEVWIGFSVQ